MRQHAHLALGDLEGEFAPASFAASGMPGLGDSRIGVARADGDDVTPLERHVVVRGNVQDLGADCDPILAFSLDLDRWHRCGRVEQLQLVEHRSEFCSSPLVTRIERPVTINCTAVKQISLSRCFIAYLRAVLSRVICVAPPVREAGVSRMLRARFRVCGAT